MHILERLSKLPRSIKTLASVPRYGILRIDPPQMATGSRAMAQCGMARGRISTAEQPRRALETVVTLVQGAMSTLIDLVPEPFVGVVQSHPRRKPEIGHSTLTGRTTVSATLTR